MRTFSSMAPYGLRIKADLENIEKLIPLSENLWKFDITSVDGAFLKTGVTICHRDLLPLEGSRGEANYVMKWKGETVQSYMKIVEVKKVDGRYKIEDSGKMVTILGIECRGLIISKWYPSMDFVAQATSGKIFEEVDLIERDWAEYDEEHDLAVSVTNLEYEIVRLDK